VCTALQANEAINKVKKPFMARYLRHICPGNVPTDYQPYQYPKGSDKHNRYVAGVVAMKGAMQFELLLTNNMQPPAGITIAQIGTNVFQ
jgi:hypothetical protein